VTSGLSGLGRSGMGVKSSTLEPDSESGSESTSMTSSNMLSGNLGNLCDLCCIRARRASLAISRTEGVGRFGLVLCHVSLSTTSSAVVKSTIEACDCNVGTGLRKSSPSPGYRLGFLTSGGASTASTEGARFCTVVPNVCGWWLRL
jgi:hypothetical protein